MNALFFEQINWGRPWLAPFLHTARPILTAPDWRLALNEAAERIDLRNHRDLPVHFVPQANLPSGVAYEAFISETGGVPTRDNLHDFFNALVWLIFPTIKRQLNALQAAEMARTLPRAEVPRHSVVRGKLRDAATIFDENAALLMTSDRDWLAGLREHRWRQVLFEQRNAFGSTVDVTLFGHALVEKLVSPYKAITAHTWVIVVEPDFFAWSAPERMAWLDTAIALQLKQGVVNADFTPLPVLGVPGWWVGQDEQFYADTGVFRSKRMANLT